eukprot:366094-Chlamydomonas_euryale.AAC.3
MSARMATPLPPSSPGTNTMPSPSSDAPQGSWLFAIPAALAYFYMVAAWGGYVFVINTIGAHAGLLWLIGRFDEGIYKAYTIFFVVGTALAVQVCA